jgi:hypothetical protein
VQNNFYVASGTGNGSVWAVGDTGLVLHSTNGGSNWVIENGNTNFDLFGLSVVNDTLAWISGDYGTIERYSASGSVLSVKGARQQRALPDHFTLHQNYPNPFNPLTHITYSLSHDATVRISIHNILGQEIVELIHQWQFMGEHSVEFDGKGYGSGVFFCTLECEGRSQTRELILLK